MPAPYTIRIFVVDGDPDGVRIVDRFNWTGRGYVFPRERWRDLRNRPELGYAGVYILFADAPSDDALPILYVGESDGLRDRIDDHLNKKTFWSWGIAFVSANRGLNKAHVQWLEYALLEQARRAGRCTFDNGNVPTAPDLTESETADVQGFLREILQILPLVGLRVFEIPAAVATPATSASSAPAPLTAAAHGVDEDDFDTVVVPAQKDGFEDVFLGQNCWYAIRISGGALSKIRWIAAYQTRPVSAITHYAPVESIEPYGDGTKYKLNFTEPARPLPNPIPFADATTGSMKGPRYTSLAALFAARKVSDLL